MIKRGKHNILDDLRNAPAYPISEAARYLNMSQATLRSWLVGRKYQTTSGTKIFKPLIDVADKSNLRLSFLDLVEAHVLSAIRRDHQVSILNIRSALDYLKKESALDRPLIQLNLETDRVNILSIKWVRLLMLHSMDRWPCVRC